jgi:hypothetical protein
MPIAISIKDLAQSIIERLQDKYGTPLPSNIEIPLLNRYDSNFGQKVSDHQIGILGDFVFDMLYKLGKLGKLMLMHTIAQHIGDI